MNRPNDLRRYAHDGQHRLETPTARLPPCIINHIRAMQDAEKMTDKLFPFRVNAAKAGYTTFTMICTHETNPSTQWFTWFQGAKQLGVVLQSLDHIGNFREFLNRVLLGGIFLKELSLPMMDVMNASDQGDEQLVNIAT